MIPSGPNALGRYCSGSETFEYGSGLGKLGNGSRNYSFGYGFDTHDNNTGKISCICNETFSGTSIPSINVQDRSDILHKGHSRSTTA